MGFPFFTGFYSKDLILEFTFSRYVIDSNLIYSLGVLAALCTAIYSIRLLYFVFLYNNFLPTFRILIDKLQYVEVECAKPMFVSMFILVLCSIFIGFISAELYFGAGHNF